MRIQHFDIINPALMPYISYYYLLSTDGDAAASTYQAFPSPNNPVGFFYDCAVSILPRKAIVTKATGQGIQEIVVGNAASPVQVVLQPGITEFCIVFKPLGINHTQTIKMGELLQHDFSATNLFDDLHSAIKFIIDGGDGIALLEEKLVNRLHETKELNSLLQIIELMSNDENGTVTKISKQLFLSYKKTYRMFMAHLGISPVQFRSILKFRNAVTNGVQPVHHKKMSGIAIDSGYYDQAHLINQFKKIAHHTPKNFLSAITLDSAGKLAWKFE